MTESVHIPLGLPGSGRRRYAAAMSLYQAGQITESALEVYRICSPLDGQDPAPLLEAVAQEKTRGLGC